MVLRTQTVVHECQRSGATACWDSLPQMRASTECSTSTAALPVVLSRDHTLGTLTWAPWPVMAAHESTQRLDAREVSQPPHGLNATTRDVFNVIVDMFVFVFVSPNCARAAAILPRGNQRLQQCHAQLTTASNPQ
jgi:hypothetical protein